MLKNIKLNTEKLINELNISEVTARILVNRGITNVVDGKKFIDSELKYMHNPKLMKGMEKGSKYNKKSC